MGQNSDQRWMMKTNAQPYASRSCSFLLLIDSWAAPTSWRDMCDDRQIFQVKKQLAAGQPPGQCAIIWAALRATCELLTQPYWATCGKNLSFHPRILPLQPEPRLFTIIGRNEAIIPVCSMITNVWLRHIDMDIYRVLPISIPYSLVVWFSIFPSDVLCNFALREISFRSKKEITHGTFPRK